jgi:hypothetical protein
MLSKLNQTTALIHHQFLISVGLKDTFTFKANKSVRVKVITSTCV